MSLVPCALAHLADNNSKVANGVLDCLLQFPKVSTSILDARESHEEAKDVVGALEDPEDPQVPHHLLQAEGLHVAVSPKNLDCFISHKPGSFRGKDLGDCSLQMVVFVASIHGAGNHVGHGLCSVVGDRHLSNLLLNRSVSVNAGSKLDPVGGMISCLGNHTPHGAGQGCSHSKSAIVQDLHRHLEPIAGLAEHILHWDGCVLKVNLCSVGALDTHLLLRRSIGDSSKAPLYDEGRDLLSLSSSSWVNNWGLGKHSEDLSNSSI